MLCTWSLTVEATVRTNVVPLVAVNSEEVNFEPLTNTSISPTIYPLVTVKVVCAAVAVKSCRFLAVGKAAILDV